jgi:AraC-like DNA-binding protein
MVNIVAKTLSKERGVLSFFAPPLIRYALEHRFAVDKLSKIVGQHIEQINFQSAEFTASQIIRMVEAIVAETEYQHVGLLIGDSIRCSDLGILGYLLLNCRKLSEVFEKYSQYYKTRTNQMELKFQVKGDKVIMQWDLIHDNFRSIEKVLKNFAIAGGVNVIKELTGNRFANFKAYFEWPVPEDASDYQRLFGNNVSFNEPGTYLEFEKEYLEIEMWPSNPDLLSIFEDRLQKEYLLVYENKVWTKRVTEILQSNPAESFSLEDVSSKLGMSSRNLQLKLSEEGVKFIELRINQQIELAKILIESDQNPVSNVAYLVGFSEPSAFFRMFKRYTGLTPTEYRSEYLSHKSEIPENPAGDP